MSAFAALEAELDEMERMGVTSGTYWNKQVHRIPDFPVLDRVGYIVHRAKAQRVLHLGSSSGHLHDAIKASAKSVIGVDHEPGPHTDIWLDLDDYNVLQRWEIPNVDLIIAGELIEHLGNQKLFLQALKKKAPSTPLLLTTPNALAEGSRIWALRGYENINKEHLVIHSWHTLDTLLRVCNWTPQAWAWYGGCPIFAEGLIVVAK
jgi:hypothetical protein